MATQERIHVNASRQLVEKAAILAQIDNQRELIDLALQEFIAIQQQYQMLDLFGDGIREDYDYKAMRHDAAD